MNALAVDLFEDFVVSGFIAPQRASLAVVRSAPVQSARQKRRHNHAERRALNRQDEKCRAVRAILDEYYAKGFETGKVGPKDITSNAGRWEMPPSGHFGSVELVEDIPTKFQVMREALKELTAQQRNVIEGTYRYGLHPVTIRGRYCISSESRVTNILSEAHKLLAAYLSGAGVVLIA